MMTATWRVIPIALVLASVSAPLDAQRARPGWIGISLDIPTVDGQVIRDSAVVIADVRRGSPAENAGLRVGDRLVSVGNVRSRDGFENLPERLRLRVGERVRVRVERDGRRREVVLRAAEWPSDLQARTVLLQTEPDSLVETMMRAMDSLRVQLIKVRDNDGTVSTRQVNEVRERPRNVRAPFEFFVFRGEDHDSLRRAMEDLNRLSEDLQRREALRVAELRSVRARDEIVQQDEVLQTVRAALQQVTQESSALRAAMSEAARVTAGFDYAIPGWEPTVPSDVEPVEPPAFRPLTPYLLGSNRVAGAQVVDLQPELAQYFDVGGGVLIVDVSPGTPAAMAGMRPGDVITRLDQVTVRSVEELRFGVSQSGESLPVSLVRRGNSVEVLLTRR